MSCGPSEPAALTRDALLGGRLVLTQPLRGHRAGTDAILLAACVPDNAAGRLVDVGAGVGAAGLAAALRCPSIEAALLEREPLLARCARENAAAFAPRARVVEADLFGALPADLPFEAADCVLTNPPFYAADAHRAPADPLRSAAYVAQRPLGEWLRRCLALLRPGGALHVIHRPDALAALLAACEGRAGGLALRPVHPREDAPAIRVLVSARKASRAPLRLLPALVLHEADGGFTRFAQRLHEGEGFPAP